MYVDDITVYCMGIKFRVVFNFADFVGDFLTMKINTMEILTAHVQHVKSMI